MDLPTIQIGTRVTLHDSEDDHVYTLTMVAPLPTRQAGEVLALTLAPEKLGLSFVGRYCTYERRP